MTDIVAAFALLLHALWWMTTWGLGIMIVSFVILAPIVYVVSLFVSSPPD